MFFNFLETSLKLTRRPESKPVVFFVGYRGGQYRGVGVKHVYATLVATGCTCVDTLVLFRQPWGLSSRLNGSSFIFLVLILTVM